MPPPSTNPSLATSGIGLCCVSRFCRRLNLGDCLNLYQLPEPPFATDKPKLFTRASIANRQRLCLHSRRFTASKCMRRTSLYADDSKTDSWYGLRTTSTLLTIQLPGWKWQVYPTRRDSTGLGNRALGQPQIATIEALRKPSVAPTSAQPSPDGIIPCGQQKKHQNQSQTYPEADVLSPLVHGFAAHGLIGIKHQMATIQWWHRE